MSIDTSPAGATASASATAPAAAAEQRRAQTQARTAAAFSQIVAVLMRDPAYRSLALGELETLVLPPLLAGQFRVAHAGNSPDAAAPLQKALAYPVAVALWARVSPAVDARLSSGLQAPARLQPAEWVSGDIPWLIVVAGHPRAVPAFLEKLKEVDFPNQTLKTRTAWGSAPAAVQ